MKCKSQAWVLLGSLLIFGLVSPLAGQTPAESAGVESALLVKAVDTGDYATALEILRSRGITNGTLEGMAARLGQPTQRVALAEPFVKGWEPWKLFRADDLMQRRVAMAVAVGYPRVLWMVESSGPTTMDTLEAQQRASVVPPIGVMDVRLWETNVAGFIQWYDRYAESLHSVALNWTYVNNRDSRDLVQASRLLNALFQLVKSRKPDAFVWLTVQTAVDKSDVRWVQTMRFGYDGLLVVGDLTDFTSRFEEIRQRYVPYVGEETPMVAAEFHGYFHALKRAAKAGGGHGKDGMEATKTGGERRAARQREKDAYAGVGRVVAPQLGPLEQRLQAMGYRGLILEARLVYALTEAASTQ